MVFAAALEGLAAAVHRPTEDTGCTIFGGAHADLAVGRGTEVAVEALVWVAGVTLGAQFSQLLGADSAATASIQYQAHTGRASRRRLSALALRGAVLAGGGPAVEGEEEHQSKAEGTLHGGDHGRGAPEDTQPRGQEESRCAAGAWTRTLGGGWCLDAPGGGVWGCRLGRLLSGGGRSPGVGVGAGVALAASSWREEQSCVSWAGSSGFYTLSEAGSPKN